MEGHEGRGPMPMPNANHPQPTASSQQRALALHRILLSPACRSMRRDRLRRATLRPPTKRTGGWSASGRAREGRDPSSPSRTGQPQPASADISQDMHARMVVTSPSSRRNSRPPCRAQHQDWSQGSGRSPCLCRSASPRRSAPGPGGGPSRCGAEPGGGEAPSTTLCLRRMLTT